MEEGCDGATHILSFMIKWLEEEGYKCTVEEGKGDFTVLCIPSIDCCNPNSTLCKDLGFTLNHFPTLTECSSVLGSIFCGGLYEAVGVFKKNDPIYHDNFINMHTIFPKGNVTILDE